MKKICKNCKWYLSQKISFNVSKTTSSSGSTSSSVCNSETLRNERLYTCKRFPQSIETWDNNFYGEWKDSNDIDIDLSYL